MKMTNQFVRALRGRIVGARVGGRDFTIVSNNCWGAHVYQALGEEYRTPFVGVFVAPSCYLKLITRFRWYLAQPLRFLEQSKHDSINALRTQRGLDFPIGCLGEDVEIQFLHYSSRAEAAETWARRVKRVTGDDNQLFFKFCDRDGCSMAELAEFDSALVTHKVCFVAKFAPELRSAIWIPNCLDGQVPDGLQLSRISPRYFDAAGWINGSKGSRSWWPPSLV